MRTALAEPFSLLETQEKKDTEEKSFSTRFTRLQYPSLARKSLASSPLAGPPLSAWVTTTEIGTDILPEASILFIWRYLSMNPT